MFMLKQQCSNRFQWKQEECIRDGNGLLPWMQVQEFRPTVWAECTKRKVLLSVRANQTFGSGTSPWAHILVCIEAAVFCVPIYAHSMPVFVLWLVVIEVVPGLPRVVEV